MEYHIIQPEVSVHEPSAQCSQNSLSINISHTSAALFLPVLGGIGGGQVSLQPLPHLLHICARRLCKGEGSQVPARSSRSDKSFGNSRKQNFMYLDRKRDTGAVGICTEEASG